MAMPVICQSCHSPHGLSLHWPLPPKFIICLAAREFSKLQSAPDTAKTHRWLPTACRIPKGLSLAFQASHHLNLAVAGSPSSFLPLSSPLTLTTWALGTFYLCALADAVPLAWNSLRLQGSAPMVAPLQRLWGRSWPDSFLGLPWLRGKSKVTGVGGVGDLRHTKSGLAIPQRPLCYRWGDIMTAGREHGCPAPSSDLPGLLGHAHSRVQSALESSRLKFKA